MRGPPTQWHPSTSRAADLPGKRSRGVPSRGESPVQQSKDARSGGKLLKGPGPPPHARAGRQRTERSGTRRARPLQHVAAVSMSSRRAAIGKRQRRRRAGARSHRPRSNTSQMATRIRSYRTAIGSIIPRLQQRLLFVKPAPGCQPPCFLIRAKVRSGATWVGGHGLCEAGLR